MTIRHVALALGLSAFMPNVAHAQVPTTAAPVLGWVRSDAGPGCYYYSYSQGYALNFWRALPEKPAATANQPAALHVRTRNQGLPGSPPVTSFEQALFAPELVMLRQDALALTSDQRKTITETLKSLETETVDLQWKVQAEQAKLIELLDQRPLKESDAAAQMAKLLDAETAVKTKHFLALVRIKSTLTDAQVQQLNVFKGCDGRG